MDAIQIKKNIAYSMFAQIISLLVSIVVVLIIPKLIDIHQYAYWQLYILYVGYVGIFHFGIIDGIMLRYSHYDYDNLDKIAIRSQYYVLLVTNILISIVMTSVIVNIMTGPRMIVMLFVAIGIISKNIFTYSSYMLQITNRIKNYATLVSIHRLIYLTIVIILLSLNVNNFIWYCAADLISDCIANVYAYIKSRDLYKGNPLKFKNMLNETYLSFAGGIFILIANWSSNLIVGAGKMIVEWKWDEASFARVALAFSLSNLFLTFINAISVVLFPSLKRMDIDQLPELYLKIRQPSSIILFIILIFYFPGNLLLNAWLPQYKDSVRYLGMLLPIIVYTSKVSLLTNNYLKTYRKEQKMLFINLLCIGLGICLYIISAFVFDNITLLLFSILFVIITRSILSEIVVTHEIHINLTITFIIESVITVLFIISAYYLTFFPGLIMYSVVLTIYLLINKKLIINTFLNITRRNL